MHVGVSFTCKLLLLQDDSVQVGKDRHRQSHLHPFLFAVYSSHPRTIKRACAVRPSLIISVFVCVYCLSLTLSCRAKDSTTGTESDLCVCTCECA